MKERTLNRSAPSLDNVCRCLYEWPDDELEELTEYSFADTPCRSCGGWVVHVPRPVWMAEEEDDC
jgi:hypothetical protein